MWGINPTKAAVRHMLNSMMRNTMLNNMIGPASC